MAGVRHIALSQDARATPTMMLVHLEQLQLEFMAHCSQHPRWIEPHLLVVCAWYQVKCCSFGYITHLCRCYWLSWSKIHVITLVSWIYMPAISHDILLTSNSPPQVSCMSLAYHHEQTLPCTIQSQHQILNTPKDSHHEPKIVHSRWQTHLWVSLSKMDAPDLQQGPEHSQTISENQNLHHRRR